MKLTQQNTGFKVCMHYSYLSYEINMENINAGSTDFRNYLCIGMNTPLSDSLGLNREGEGIGVGLPLSHPTLCLCTVLMHT